MESSTPKPESGGSFIAKNSSKGASFPNPVSVSKMANINSTL